MPISTAPAAAGQGDVAPATDDGAMLKIEAELRHAEARLASAVRAQAAAEQANDMLAQQIADRAMAEAEALVDLVLTRMAATPARGLAGVSAKAARLCQSLICNGGDLLVAEERLAESLLRDCQRLTRDAAGATAVAR